MTKLGWIAVLIGTGACAQILGDDFEIETDATGGPSSSTATGGAAMASSSTGAQGGAGVGGGGGPPTGPCDPYVTGECGPNRKCSVVNLSTGETTCIDTISKPAWSGCENDGECVDGTFCSPLNRVCKPYCDENSDCGNPGLCTDAWLELYNAIPNIRLCAANCNPVTVSPCVAPGANCIYTGLEPNTAGFDCVRAGNIPEDGPCDGETAQDLTADCIARHGCFGNPTTQMGQCYEWCEPIGGQAGCATGKTCAMAVPGYSWGICQ